MVFKGQKLPWKTDKKKFRFNVTFQDASGTVRAVAFNDNINRFMKELEYLKVNKAWTLLSVQKCFYTSLTDLCEEATTTTTTINRSGFCDWGYCRFLLGQVSRCLTSARMTVKNVCIIVSFLTQHSPQLQQAIIRGFNVESTNWWISCLLSLTGLIKAVQSEDPLSVLMLVSLFTWNIWNQQIHLSLPVFETVQKWTETKCRNWYTLLDWYLHFVV